MNYGLGMQFLRLFDERDLYGCLIDHCETSKQLKEFLASLILRTLAWWQKCPIELRTGSSLKSVNMGWSILMVSAIFSKWSLNILTKYFSSVITLSPSTRVILSSLRVFSVQFGLMVCQVSEVSIVGYFLHIEIIEEILLGSS